MKKCSRCKIVFHNDERNRCLYCDMKLLTVEKDDTIGFRDDKNFDISVVGVNVKREVAILKKLVNEWELSQYLRAQFVVGTYFKVRSFKFLYSFSRNHFKMGPDYKRLLVQPLTMASWLTIPWVIIDIVDSFYIRLTNNAYCDQCGWKFYQVYATQKHDATECEYNLEYSRIVREILSGNVSMTEGLIKDRAYKKILGGKRSAYKDLCSRRTQTGFLMDIFSIWISIIILLAIFIVVTLPIYLKFGKFLSKD